MATADILARISLHVRPVVGSHFAFLAFGRAYSGRASEAFTFDFF
jgi:hypothetical protein